MVKTEKTTYTSTTKSETSRRLWLSEATEVFLRLEYADQEIQCKRKARSLAPPHSLSICNFDPFSNYDPFVAPFYNMAATPRTPAAAAPAAIRTAVGCAAAPARSLLLILCS